MKERLLIVVTACALLVGGWAGVYAAAACAHAGGAASSRAASSHDCCRGHEGGEAPSCPMKGGASHGAPHAEREEGRVEAVKASASKSRRAGTPAVRAVWCAHCVGSRLPPSPAGKLSAPEVAQRGDVVAPPRAEKLPHAAPLLYVREVIPSQGAPPGRARLHVLHSVFLI